MRDPPALQGLEGPPAADTERADTKRTDQATSDKTVTALETDASIYVPSALWPQLSATRSSRFLIAIHVQRRYTSAMSQSNPIPWLWQVMWWS